MASDDDEDFFADFGEEDDSEELELQVLETGTIRFRVAKPEAYHETHIPVAILNDSMICTAMLVQQNSDVVEAIKVATVGATRSRAKGTQDTVKSYEEKLLGKHEEEESSEDFVFSKEYTSDDEEEAEMENTYKESSKKKKSKRRKKKKEKKIRTKNVADLMV